jgi:hypothetical protein
MMTVLSVLVVEDDAMIGMLLAEMLRETGYGVCAIAATEDDAVADATRCNPGLMIVDQQLLEGSGLSAADWILWPGPFRGFLSAAHRCTRNGPAQQSCKFSDPVVLAWPGRSQFLTGSIGRCERPAVHASHHARAYDRVVSGPACCCPTVHSPMQFPILSCNP